MTRPDPTPPDPSLFPIAPTYTADLDAKALDQIADSLNFLRLLQSEGSKLSTQGLAVACMGEIPKILRAVRTTGRKV